MLFLTKYIYPLQSPIPISSKLGFYLDNPRTKEELKTIERYIESTINSPQEVFELNYSIRIPTSSKKDKPNSYDLKKVLTNFHNCYAEEDSYVENIFRENSKESQITLLSKIWVIVRLEYDIPLKDREKIRPITIFSGEKPRLFSAQKNHPLILKSNELVSFTYLFSLFINTEKKSYQGDSFILHDDMMSIHFPTFDLNLNQVILSFGMSSYTKVLSNKENNWSLFYHIKGKIKKIAETIDSSISESNKEKVLYIANLLQTINRSINDERIKLISLVGIIELILISQNTRGADSISKQFRCKVSKIVYEVDKERTLEELKKRLKIIYQQRSNIVHGNIPKLQNFIQEEQRLTGQEDIIGLINLELFRYIRIILWEYFNNRNFIENLKRKKKTNNCA